MAEKVYVVTDLGPGDGGKGVVVHKLSTMLPVRYIVKDGGAQGSHGVCTSRGERFAFSQWGCGTLEGVRTHLSTRIVIHPEGILNEAEALRYTHGINNPFDLLTVDESALCATPFHGISSRLKELARGNNPRGTIGTGVGEAYRAFQRIPERAIFARDLSRSDLRDRLAAVRADVQNDLAEVVAGVFLPEDREEVNMQIALLYDDGLLNHAVNRFAEVARRAKIVGNSFLGETILAHPAPVVVERSHGVLTDNMFGFHPHTSAIRTLPRFTEEMLRGAGFDGKIVNLGIHRAYTIRHGAGPMPTADPSMGEHLLPGSHKHVNRYQGKVRVGALDLVLLRYAIACCGGPSAFDGLGISWFDQVCQNGHWDLSYRYTNPLDPTYFDSDGSIRVWSGEEGEAQKQYQEQLGQQLFDCVPEIQTRMLSKAKTQDELFDLCDGVIREALGVPVRLVSFGPTERDKVCK